MDPGGQDDLAGPEPAAEPPSGTVCAVCGRPQLRRADSCPWCQLESGRLIRARRKAPGHGTDTGAFHGILLAFGLVLTTNVILGLILPELAPGLPLTQSVCRQYLTVFSGAEAFATLVILITMGRHFHDMKLPAEAGRNPWQAWWMVLPLLAGLLLINVGYHQVLLWMSGAEPVRDRVADSGYYPGWQLILNCVQPALVEELFFRGLVFGWLSRSVGFGNAAFASSSMFAAAHTGGLSSFPVLFLIGTALAWLRWKSGSLLPGILVHFLHNLALGFL